MITSESFSFIPKQRLYDDTLRRFAWGTDASFYRLTPQLVIRSESETEVSRVLAICSEKRWPVTFRAAGTSLSGQSISNSILLVAAHHWNALSISTTGDVVTLQPGVIGSTINRVLAPYGRHFGPDPASINSCRVGGIIANNASGMSCGVHTNADHLLISARIIFADGTILDTADRDSRAGFRATHQAFIKSIEQLRDDIRSDEAVSERIYRKYKIKNVTGLNLRPFIAYDDPFDIIAHLMVGSEGTLGFVSEVSLRTVPSLPYKASAMLFFPSIVEATKAVVAMKGLSLTAAELLDHRSLAAMGINAIGGLTAILAQTEADTPEELKANILQIESILASFNCTSDSNGNSLFTTDEKKCAEWWKIRSGIFPMVGGMRREGTTCLIEDVAFPLNHLPDATADLSELLDRHGYDDSCIYGHALEGNFHFIINQSFDTSDEVERYERLIRDVTALVVKKYDGSLKAEHGTGRNMAPFVAYEWGEKIYSYMRRVKALFDPLGILNPGVIFNDDPLCFLHDLKSLPILHPVPDALAKTEDAYRLINRCIECGFCEVNCMSCGLTLSSRTRIATQREICRLSAQNTNPRRLAELLQQYSYQGLETCAADGLCSTSCPMNINVADLTHELRRISVSASNRFLWRMAANHYHPTKNLLRFVLGAAWTGRSILGDKTMQSVCRTVHEKIGIPLWTPSIPRSYNARAVQSDSTTTDRTSTVVYLPSCINQMMGISKKTIHSRPLAEEMIELLHKAGYSVIVPNKKDTLCCGMIWESKGMPDIAEQKVRELDDALWEASQHGQWPVLCDQSPCLHRMRKCITRLHLYEPAEFIETFLVNRLVFHCSEIPVALHITCSTRLMHVDGMMRSLAERCSSNVIIPEGVGCCGFAGDKGLTCPEVNAYALRHLRDNLEKQNVQEGYSNSRTCEIGLETHSGIPYRSIVYLVNQSTTSKKNIQYNSSQKTESAII